MLLWILAAIAGVFLAIDLFLFYLLLGNDFHPALLHHRHLGSRKPHIRRHKILYLHPAGSLFMLLGILGLYVYQWEQHWHLHL